MTDVPRETPQPEVAEFIRLLKMHMAGGTRPPKKEGQSDEGKWTDKLLAGEIGRGANTIANYKNGRSFPPEVEPFERAFFGPVRDPDPNQEERLAFRRIYDGAQTEWDAKSKHKLRAKGRRLEAPSFSSQPNFAVRVPRHLYRCEEALVAIKDVLHRRQGPVVLCGMPGVGKTVLTHTYADRHLLNYRLIWQIDASTEESCITGLVALSLRLGWTSDDTVASVALDEMIYCLMHQGGGLLLIYENARDADFLEPFLQKRTDAHILITSNNPAWQDIGTRIAIETWSEDVGTEFLLARTNRPQSEKMDAKALSELLDGLPLAHEQAAAYCDQSGVSFQRYRELFEVAPIKFLSDAGSVPRQYGRTVAKTFSLAIDGARERCRASAALITCIALLAPEPVPLFALTRSFHILSMSIGGIASDKELEDAIVALRAFSLVDRISAPDQIDPSIRTDCLTLHRLVREVAANEKRDEQMPRRDALISALSRLYPNQVNLDPLKWPELRLLESHSMYLLGMLPKQDLQHAIIIYWLNGIAGFYQYVKKSYDMAAETYYLPLENLDLNNTNELWVAAFANNLGLPLLETDRIKDAIYFLATSLKIRASHFEPPHPEIAIVLHNIGIALHRDGQLTESPSGKS